jgi:hypothetical protein
LSEIEESSRKTNVDTSQKAKDFLSLLSKGASFSADLVQVLTFLSGTSSLPLLFRAAGVATNMLCKSEKISNRLSLSEHPKRLPKRDMRIV